MNSSAPRRRASPFAPAATTTELRSGFEERVAPSAGGNGKAGRATDAHRGSGLRRDLQHVELT